MEDSFNFIEDLERGFDQNGQAPEPEPAPEVETEDFDNLGGPERQQTAENRKTDWNREQEEKRQASEAMIDAQAGMITGLVNMVNKTLCAWISKGERDDYGISKSELADYKEVTKDYLKTVEKPVMSPGETFLATTFVLVGGNVLAALDDKKRNERERKEQEARRRAQEARTYEEAQAAKEDLEEVLRETPRPEESQPRRNQFQVDANGFYMYDVAGKYLKGKKRAEKAPADILKMIQIMERDEKMTKGLINEQIRLKLYGTKNPV